MSYRVYIVEDDRTIAEELRLLLAQWGYEAMITADFRAVTEEVKAFDPQLILMDIGLPYYNGYYWCGEIRRFSTVPVVFLSSAADNMNIVMAMDMGGDDFIAKPFDSAVLMAKLRSVLRRSYDFTAAAPTLEYRGARLDPADQSLSYGGGASGAEPQRVPHPADAAGKSGPHCQPGEAHGGSVADGQLRG